TADRVSPIEGGYSRHRGPNGELRGRTLSLAETAGFWRAVDRCPPGPGDTRTTEFSSRNTTAGGVGGARVAAWTVLGGGHTWPGARPFPGAAQTGPREYHADVIGSLLRPRYLSEARAALAAGRINNTEFKRIEDRAVDQAIAMQEGCGLDVVNDGELRRFSFLDHLLGDMEGVADMPGAPVHFHAPDPAQDWNWHPPFTVTGRIRPKGPMMTIEEFSYARGRARVPVKITMPSPLVMYGAWSPEHSRPAYSDPFELFADAADIIRAEAAELARLGCTYIQIDSPDFGTLVDPENRALREGLGISTERTLTEGVDIINSVADVPGVTFGLHICKGNYESKWIATGGYEFTAGKVFSRSTNFDVFLLEYDDERSGSFEPLAD